MQIKDITSSFSVSGQMQPEDFAALARDGFTLVVNNRPDGEEPGQPLGSEIESAVRAAGLDYVAIPVSGAGLGAAQVDAMVAALTDEPGRTLAFCRSGTRSSLLWALAQSSRGGDPVVIATQVENAGYSAEPVRPAMVALSAKAGARD